MTIPSDNNPLKEHGNAEDFGGPHEPPMEPREKQYQDSCYIMTRVVIGAIIILIGMVIAHFFSK